MCGQHLQLTGQAFRAVIPYNHASNFDLDSSLVFWALLRIYANVTWLQIRRV
jgi:hypothetical protein